VAVAFAVAVLLPVAMPPNPAFAQSSRQLLAQADRRVERFEASGTQAAGDGGPSCDTGRAALTAQPSACRLLVASGGLGLILRSCGGFLGGEQTGDRWAASREDGIQQITITVDAGLRSQGGYQGAADSPCGLPSTASIPCSCVAPGCFFPDFSAVLDPPSATPTVLELLPEKPGRYPFHLRMTWARRSFEVGGSEGQRRRRMEPRSKGKEIANL